MTLTTLVYYPIKNVHARLTALPVFPNLLLNPLGEEYPSVKTRSLKVSGVENYRKTLEIEGISSSATKLVSMPRRPGAIAGYEYA